jgi:hypothetical protein
VVERFIGFVVPFAALLGMGFGFSRWFEWRRSLFRRVGIERTAAGHASRLKRESPAPSNSAFPAGSMPPR